VTHRDAVVRANIRRRGKARPRSAREAAALKRRCETCGAVAGDYCRTESDERADRSHSARIPDRFPRDGVHRQGGRHPTASR
jgi:hypothetical protein